MNPEKTEKEGFDEIERKVANRRRFDGLDYSGIEGTH
jgi:hypothetical protein